MSFKADLYLAINHARMIPAIRNILKWQFSIQEPRYDRDVQNQPSVKLNRKSFDSKQNKRTNLRLLLLVMQHKTCNSRHAPYNNTFNPNISIRLIICSHYNNKKFLLVYYVCTCVPHTIIFKYY